jgi:hypothetical protein
VGLGFGQQENVDEFASLDFRVERSTTTRFETNLETERRDDATSHLE